MLADARRRDFFARHADGVVQLVAALARRYDDDDDGEGEGEGVSIRLGGEAGWRCRHAIGDILAAARRVCRREVGLDVSWVRGRGENPAHLSLPQIRREGLRGPGWFVADGPGVYGPGVHAYGPGVYALGLLTPVSWSENSTTSFYIAARNDERAARDLLTQVLTFAVRERQPEGLEARFDFPPAAMDQRRLVHDLAKDLGLGSASMGDVGETFVRITHLPSCSKNMWNNPWLLGTDPEGL